MWKYLRARDKIFFGSILCFRHLANMLSSLEKLDTCDGQIFKGPKKSHRHHHGCIIVIPVVQRMV